MQKLVIIYPQAVDAAGIYSAVDQPCYLFCCTSTRGPALAGMCIGASIQDGVHPDKDTKGDDKWTEDFV